MTQWTLIAYAALTIETSPANALCIYHGVDNAKTTLAQEFRDSRWVVRAHVMSADYHWSDEDESWTLYRLKVVQSYKGNLRSRFTFFTERNSGGFYLDADGGGPDLDQDYLLFLVADGWSKVGRPTARGALWVNYNCGQSRPWSDVTKADELQLTKLSLRNKSRANSPPRQSRVVRRRGSAAGRAGQAARIS